MKKFRNVFLLLCLFIPLSFVGCKSNDTSLSTPKIVDIRGGTIIFNTINNADYYTISINGNEIVVNPYESTYTDIEGNTVKYDASKIFKVGDDYSVKIKANASKKSSSYSAVYSYRHRGSVKQPTNVKINSTTLTWDPVNNISYYSVKIITPNDKLILDHEGNILQAITPETIPQADITEYYFNTNSFDFSSIINHAGQYKFYVCSVVADGMNYIESEYTNPITYTNNVELSTPKNGKIYKIDNELYLMTILDPNSNAISITCEGVEKTAEINGSDQSISKLSDNVVNVNLTKFFEASVEAGSLNLENYKTYAFNIQSKYISPDVETSFYLDSEVGSDIIFENTYRLEAPTLKVKNNDDGTYLISWESNETDLLTAYKLIVCTPTEVKEYALDLSVENMILGDEFVAAAIQGIGKGNYLTSTFSDFVYPVPKAEQELFSVNLSASTVSWTSSPSAYSVIVIDDEYRFVNNSYYTFTVDDFKSKTLTFRHHLIEVGHRYSYNEKTVESQTKLERPTFTANQGFKSENIYELTFTGVENAIGYYVYIKGQNSSTAKRLETLYTTTTIDLSEYIISTNAFSDYSVYVQAVADTNGVYSDSSLSNVVYVSHIKVLDKPEFFKINGITTPVIKQTVADTTKYILQFYHVDDAYTYELLINYNRLVIQAEAQQDVYSVDITSYLTAANNYEIRVKAIPQEGNSKIIASDYNVTHYSISKQLPMVNNVRVVENEGVYTLSFDPVDNAEKYLVRIAKENDSNYIDYLNNLGLHNLIYVKSSLDVSDYVQQRGVYNFYVTAIAPESNSYYADSNESINYATISKLTTLKTPSDIGYDNASENSYSLYWTGDENADYYKIKLTDPNGVDYEFNSFAESFNINRYMTVQGDYSISIFSMVNATGENAKEYASSAATLYGWRYLYETEKDFLRYSVLMNGSAANFVASSANSLKNLLWNHYLFGTGLEGLSVMLKHNDSTAKEEIIKLSLEATQLNLYNFTGTNDLETLIKYTNHIDQSSGDTTWYSMIGPENSSNLDLFKYVTRKLLSIYPELNYLENFSMDTVSSTSTATIFNMKYSNALDGVKESASDSIARTLTNYGTAYKYIDVNARKSPSGAFAIDGRNEAFVTTTEQLVQIVQHNMKPKFVGESTTAQLVYNNAKIVLSAIISNNMTDLDKVSAIFDWLEANFDLTYYNIESSTYISGAVEKTNMQQFGKYKHYYLEGIFEDITIDEATGQITIGSNLATSWSYSKAFALLCAIEGIDSKVIYGTYDFYDSHLGGTGKNATAEHVWNKVCLSTSDSLNERSSIKEWFVVDTTLSDNRIFYNDLQRGYGISSHTHFLVTDSFIKGEGDFTTVNKDLTLQLVEKTYLISTKYQSDLHCSTSYNYYKNSSFGLTYAQIDQSILDFENGFVKGFNYSKFYTPETSGENGLTYQRYSGTVNLGDLEAYLLNAIIYSTYMAKQNPNQKSVFEFTIEKSVNGNSYIFDKNKLFEIATIADNKYTTNLNIMDEGIWNNNNIYSIVNPMTATTTVIFIVEKIA